MDSNNLTDSQGINYIQEPNWYSSLMVNYIQQPNGFHEAWSPGFPRNDSLGAQRYRITPVAQRRHEFGALARRGVVATSEAVRKWPKNLVLVDKGQ